MTGLYIHVPFCLRKCPYCDFYSIPFDDNTADMYARAVCGAISSGMFSPGIADTVYFGGGTPSLLGARRLSAILEEAARSYGIDPGAEITLEANPAAGNEALFRDLRLAGFNRLSIGAQSFADGELSGLGRLHSADDAYSALLSAYDAGFDNISCDLMLATPGQTPESLKLSIERAASAPVSHISAYLLKIEEGTVFYAKNTAMLCPDEDGAAELYLDCTNSLEARGFYQYETSNFAKPGMESRHNLKYWRCEPYLGIGPSAHSFLNGKRFYLGRDLAGFIRDPASALIDDGDGGGFEEYAMLRLRLREGLELSRAAELYGADVYALLSRAEPMIAGGLMIYEDGNLSLTARGFLVSNAVTAKLLYG